MSRAAQGTPGPDEGAPATGGGAATTGTPGPRARGSYAKGIARRQEILDRAIEVFAQRGGSRTSLRAIAQEVGVTHAALTHYFGSLDELLVAVYDESQRRGDAEERELHRVAATGTAPAAGPDAAPADIETATAVSPAEMMRASAAANREIPGLVQLYSSLVAAALDGTRPAAHAFITARFARLRTELADQVRAQQRTGALRGDVDADLIAALVIAASDGLQTQWLLDPTVDHEAALRMLDDLLAAPPVTGSG